MFDSLEPQAKLHRARVRAGSQLAKAIALAGILAAIFAYAAAAQAHGVRPGVRSAAPTSRALSQSLAQTTGLSLSQVTSQDICGATRPGYARCAGQALVLRSSHALVRPHVRRQATFGRVKPAFVPGFASPALGSGASPPQPGTPAYLQQAYDLSYLSQTAGVGDTIAIVDPFDDPHAESDLATYRSTYGLPACTTANGCFRKVSQRGDTSTLPSPNSTWEQEISLDLDAASALCPNCHIILVEADSGLYTDLAAAQQTAATLGANQISDSWTIPYSGILPGRYVFPHVSTVAATGDAGYVGPGVDNFPAAFSSVAAAGGTSLAAGSANGRGFSEAAWSGAGSGCDLNVTKPTYQTDTGCAQQASGGRTLGRAYADLSADADPATGLSYYDTGKGGWGVIGGTSLASPLIAAYYAITGVSAGTPQWAYNSSALLNDPTSGSTGTCASNIRYICTAGVGYDGPTGVGSISGAVVAGAPGIGGPSTAAGSSNTYTLSTRSQGATVQGGIYPNGLDTTWWIEYGADKSYGQHTPHTDVGSGTSSKLVTGYLSHLDPGATYHYRLVAQNSRGSTYGYDYTFTTPQASPTDPTAAFASPTAATPNSPVTFDASTSNDAGDTIVSYAWDFGDGQTSPPTPSAAINHPYTSPGTYYVTLIVTNSDGHSDSTTKPITVDQPQASFTVPQTITAPNAPANFDASGSTDSQGQITDYRWDFGDGTPVFDANTSTSASHAYASRGKYVVQLTVTNSFGQTATTPHTITVDTAPTAGFSPPSGIQPTNSQLIFDGSASMAAAGGTIKDYSWNFGDNSGTADSGTSPTTTHSYSHPGVYTVALTVTDELGVSNTTTQTVTVDHPQPAFTSSPTPIAPNSAATFDAGTSSDPEGTITDYTWDFGDGSGPIDAVTSPTTTHTYTARGPHTVKLTITNNSDQTESITHTVTVDTGLAAAFTPSASVATPASSLNFDGSTSNPPDGGMIKDYSWNFGDGSGTTDTQSVATTSHSYNTPGSYTVTLTVTDDLFVTSTATHTVTIDQPHAAFTTPPTITAPGSAASFDASGSTDPAGTIDHYSWDFGDGSTATRPSPTTSHSYATRGHYDVTLTITNNSNQTESITHTITVDTAPIAAFTPPANAQRPDSPVSFDGTTSAAGGSPPSYSWNFGDGGTGSGGEPNHTYSSPGRYTVTLTVTDDLGVISTTTSGTVTVDAPPTASFSASPNPAGTGPAVVFDARGSSDSLGNITNYSWDFGDGAPGSGQTASHAYGMPGRYTISLTINNDAGQTSTTTRSITVDAAPSALFSVSPSAARTGVPVSFNGSSSNDAVGTITAYNWNFGDGTTANSPSPSHIYASAGTYPVALTVTNDAGQSTTSSQTVTVYAAPSAAFSAAPATTLPGAAVSFNAGGSSDAGGTITGYSWNFGDGGSANGPSPSHAYARPAVYTVTLTVTGSLGLATSTSHSVTVNPPALSAQLSSTKRQKLRTVLKHGLSLTVSTNTAAKASFVVTMQVHASKRGHPHAKHGSRSTTSTLLRTHALSFAPGPHGVALKLSRVSAGKLHAGTGAVLTVHMTLIDVYGRQLSRSAKVTISS